MKLKEACDAFEYKIYNGEKSLWNCFTLGVRVLDFEINDETTASVVYNPHVGEVYMAQVWDGSEGEYYVWVDPDYRNAYKEECVLRGIDPDKHTDHTTESGFFDKVDILLGKKSEEVSEENETVNIDIDDVDILHLALKAHELDITLNAYMVKLLKAEIEKYEEEGRKN